MEFWGAIVSEELPYILPYTPGITRPRLHITRATLTDGSTSSPSETNFLKVTVGSAVKPVILCCLTRRYNGANLDIQFEENKHVMLTVQGPGKVHLIGHYLNPYEEETGNFQLSDLPVLIAPHQPVDEELRKFVGKFISFAQSQNSDVIMTDGDLRCTKGISLIVDDLGTFCNFSLVPRNPSRGEIEKNNRTNNQGVIIKELENDNASVGMVSENSEKHNIHVGKGSKRIDGSEGKSDIAKMKKKRDTQLTEDEVYEQKIVERSENKVIKKDKQITDEKGSLLEDSSTGKTMSSKRTKSEEKKNRVTEDETQKRKVLEVEERSELKKKKKEKSKDVEQNTHDLVTPLINDAEMVEKNMKPKKKTVKN